MQIQSNGNPMAAMMQIGLARLRGKRKAFWRMCMCGQQFFAVKRQRKVCRRKAEEHVQRCRAKARERANGQS